MITIRYLLPPPPPTTHIHPQHSRAPLPDILEERKKYYGMGFEERQEYLIRQLEKFKLPDDPKLGFYFTQVCSLEFGCGAFGLRVQLP
jgi:hypothetical protein